MESPKTTGRKFENLVEIMTKLRGPDGCPWDKQQDFNSLKRMLVEKAEKLKSRTPEQRSLLEGIPTKLPAIHEAHQIASRAARAGFDWPDIEGVFEKLQEEVLELKEVIAAGGDAGRRERLEDEIGD